MFRWTISCAQDPDATHISISLLGIWAIALACGMLCKEQWRELIHSGKNEVSYDLGISHLSGLSSCVSPWHLVPESHCDNLARKSCHKVDRCNCRQDPRCEVGPNRTAIPDAQTEWRALLRKAHDWVFQCPVCDFTVKRTADLKIGGLGVKIAKHYGTHVNGNDQASDSEPDPEPEVAQIRGRGRQQIVREVLDSQSPEPVIAPSPPPARPLQ